MTKKIQKWASTLGIIHILRFEAFWTPSPRVSVQGVVSLGGHFATLCREFDFYEVKKKSIYILFFKKKREILLHF